jgi:hypothetical protein
VASDINFLDAPGAAAGGGASPATHSSPANKSDDVVIQDLDANQNINLDDIPF